MDVKKEEEKRGKDGVWKGRSWGRAVMIGGGLSTCTGSYTDVSSLSLWVDIIIIIL